MQALKRAVTSALLEFFPEIAQANIHTTRSEDPATINIKSQVRKAYDLSGMRIRCPVRKLNVHVTVLIRVILAYCCCCIIQVTYVLTCHAYIRIVSQHLEVELATFNTLSNIIFRTRLSGH